ncbi:solute carrier family 23 member 1-like isoform 1-T2 [Polymixia lowei]
MADGNESSGLFAFPMDERVNDQPRRRDRKSSESKGPAESSQHELAYCVTDTPPWYLCIPLAVQNYLTAFGGIITIPLVLSEALCLEHDGLTQSYLISTIFFVSGLCTLLQVTFGIRLPILQGATFALLAPSLAMLSMPEWKCPAWTHNASLVNTSSPVFVELWQTRMRILQGSIMVGSVFQILIGLTGVIGFVMRFIGPLTIAPTISLIGLSLFQVAGAKAGEHWGISVMTTVWIVLFSQYLCRIPVPLPAYSKTKKFHVSKIYIFQLIPVLLGITISWLICYILTVTNVLPSDPNQYGHLARTDLKGDVVGQASWFTFPYPGQWGVPTVSVAGVFGIMAGIISSVIESVGDYHACARLSGAPPPPRHAINRGIAIEGIGGLLAGAWGTGNGTTSFSENVGALGITKVGSRMVIAVSGGFMILMGILSKIGAIFTTIPSPVVGGMFLVMFGVITATGIANLQFADMNCSRNIFIFGFSMFSALAIPDWIKMNPDALSTGVEALDQVLQVLLTTSMFVGGSLGFFLDNTIPGTAYERGISTWNKAHLEGSHTTVVTEDVYDLPFGMTSYLSSYSWVRYVPFCPWKGQSSQNKSEEGEGSNRPENNLQRSSMD